MHTIKITPATSNRIEKIDSVAIIESKLFFTELECYSRQYPQHWTKKVALREESSTGGQLDHDCTKQSSGLTQRPTQHHKA